MNYIEEVELDQVECLPFKEYGSGSNPDTFI